MMEDLRPYSEYKDSDAPWLGEVPKHWSVLPNRAIFAEVKERGHIHEEMLSVTISQGIIRQAELLANSSKKDSSNEDKANYKLVCPGDFAYNKMRAWQGAAGVSKYRGIVSPAYIVVRPYAAQEMRYFHYLFRTPAFAKEAERWSYGISSDQWSLRIEEFKRIYTSLPPPEEQTAIVRFLGHADRRIRRYIRTKRRLIALLNEQKQAIIHRAVTRGLDSSVRLKPSGVEWLGEVPEHWVIVTLGRLSSTRCDGPFGSGLKSSHYTDAGVRVIRLQNIRFAEFRNIDGAYISSEHYATLGDHDVKEDDLLVAGLGDEGIPAGRACVAPSGIEPAMVKADCFRFRLKNEQIVPQFAALQLSATARDATACLSTGATRQRINLQVTSWRKLAIPPERSEQHEILHHIEKTTRCITDAVQRLSDLISAIREYRTRLIADVVTGQLDVREAAASLPEVTDEEPLDDLLLKDEEMSEEAELDTEPEEVEA